MNKISRPSKPNAYLPPFKGSKIKSSEYLIQSRTEQRFFKPLLNGKSETYQCNMMENELTNLLPNNSYKLDLLEARPSSKHR